MTYTAEQLAAMDPEAAYQQVLKMSEDERRALWEELDDPAYRKLRADLNVRDMRDNLNANVREENAD